MFRSWIIMCRCSSFRVSQAPLLDEQPKIACPDADATLTHIARPACQPATGFTQPPSPHNFLSCTGSHAGGNSHRIDTCGESIAAMDKLNMSLDDMISAAPAKGGRGKGKGRGGRGGESTGRGGAVRTGGGGKAARAAAAPYQRGSKQTLSSMIAPKQQVVGLTTGTKLRVGNLDFKVTPEDITVTINPAVPP